MAILAGAELTAYLIECRKPLRKELNCKATPIFGEPEDPATYRVFGSHPGVNMKKFTCLQAVELVGKEYLRRDQNSRYVAQQLGHRQGARHGEVPTCGSDLMPGFSSLQKAYDRMGYKYHPATNVLQPPQVPDKEDEDCTVVSRASTSSRVTRPRTVAQPQHSESMPNLASLAMARDSNSRAWTDELSQARGGPRRHQSVTDLGTGKRPRSMGGRSAVSMAESTGSFRPFDTMKCHEEARLLILKNCARSKVIKLM